MKNIRNKVFLNSFSEDVEKNMLEIRDLTKKEALSLLLASGEFEESVEHYKNLNKGIDFLLNAMANDENIAIKIDDDTDGFMSSALMYQVIYDDFEYENITYILNNKKKHGFELNKLDSLIENDIKLLIMPDSGSTDIEPLQALTNKGIKVLILDHHEIEIKDKLHDIEDNIALINNQDGNVENIYLSGCGVTYKFCKELVECCDGDIGNKYLDLVACSLVSDVCDLKYSYENRYYLNKGSKISNITNLFLSEMASHMGKNKKDKFSIEDFGFSIAPVINAIIRLGSKEEKEILFNALIGTEDFIPHRGKAVTYQKKIRLLGQNYQKKQRERKKELSNKICEELNKKILNNIILYIDENDEIERPLTGLIANGISDIYERCTLIGKPQDEVINGSARTYDDFDLKKFCEQSHLFEYCLGHSGSFGFSIKRENINKFIEYSNKFIKTEKKLIKVEKIYDNYIPSDDVKKIVSYENLWCNSIETPLYLLENAIFKVKNITKIGNSTYKFENDNITIYKYFCSKKAFEELVEEKQDNDYVILDALVEFRYKFGRKIIIKDWEKIK